MPAGVTAEAEACAPGEVPGSDWLRSGDTVKRMNVEVYIPPKLGRELEELAAEQEVSVETLILNGARLLLEHRHRRNHVQS